MAQKSQNYGDPSLCANNCGFYGNPATNNFCSKCYKDYLMKQTKDLGSSANKLGDQNEMIILNNKEKLEEEQEVVELSSGEVGSTSNDSGNYAENKASNRCSLCKKRVGLTGFKCRCGQTFCSLHRYSDKHNCAFDYKGAAQDAIARANPVVKADKIDKI